MIDLIAPDLRTLIELSLPKSLFDKQSSTYPRAAFAASTGLISLDANEEIISDSISSFVATGDISFLN